MGKKGGHGDGNHQKQGEGMERFHADKSLRQKWQINHMGRMRSVPPP
jgi:hypothetical protein